jgi:membrane-associated HD superfamily phosphohydrolase
MWKRINFDILIENKMSINRKIKNYCFYGGMVTSIIVWFLFYDYSAWDKYVNTLMNLHIMPLIFFTAIRILNLLYSGIRRKHLLKNKIKKSVPMIVGDSVILMIMALLLGYLIGTSCLIFTFLLIFKLPM